MQYINRTINGKTFTGHYEILPVARLITTHNEKTFAVNKAFPCKNDRAYEVDKTAMEMVHFIAANFDDRAYFDTPIVIKQADRYYVISGNNRVMSYKLSKKYDLYRNALQTEKENIDKHTIKPMKIFVLDTDEPITTRFMAFFNHNDQKQMSAIEKSISISKILGTEGLKDLNAYIYKYENLTDFYQSHDSLRVIKYLINKGLINRFEVGAYHDPITGLNEAGKRFLECIFIGTIFSDEVIRVLSTDGMKNLMQRFVKTSLLFVSNRNLKNKYSIIPSIEEAILTVYKARKAGLDTNEYLAQSGLDASFYDTQITETACAFINTFKMSQKDFTILFEKVIERLTAADNGQSYLLSGKVESREEILHEYFDIKAAPCEPAPALTDKEKAQDLYKELIKQDKKRTWKEYNHTVFTFIYLLYDYVPDVTYKFYEAIYFEYKKHTYIEAWKLKRLLDECFPN
jgi:hypothetical protein